VRVMADYGTEGLWTREGYMMLGNALPVSTALMARLRCWCRWYETNTDYCIADSTFDYVDFAATGLEIAKAIKRELPNWTIIYFDEAILHQLILTGAFIGDETTHPPQHLWDYEITTDNNLNIPHDPAPP